MNASTGNATRRFLVHRAAAIAATLGDHEPDISEVLGLIKEYEELVVLMGSIPADQEAQGRFFTLWQAYCKDRGLHPHHGASALLEDYK